MRKRILTMTVAAVTVIAAMTGCNKKDAGSVETTKQEVETTTVAETTTEVETTTEYSLANDPYYNADTAVFDMTYTDVPLYCFIDGDTYMAITGAECIAENVPVAEEYIEKPNRGAYSELAYYGHENGISMGGDLHDGFRIDTINNLYVHDGLRIDAIKKIYTVPANPYLKERVPVNIPKPWIGGNGNYNKVADCIRFLCEFDIDGDTHWNYYDKDGLKDNFGINIEDYIDLAEYEASLAAATE